MQKIVEEVEITLRKFVIFKSIPKEDLPFGAEMEGK
jgi:hypothetical protein